MPVATVEVLGYVGATASDLDAWRDFTTAVLGLEISADSTDDLLLLRCDEQHHRFSIRAGDVDDVDHVGWEVQNERALTALVESLAAAGIQVEPGTDAEIAERCVLQLVWFVCPYTRVRMELFVGSEILFQPHFHASRPIGEFVTGDQGLGHIVLYAPDLVAAEAFYHDVLGFGTTDRVVVPGVGQVASFMHCNSRHHTLALMRVPETPRRLQHVMLEPAGIDAVGTTYDICTARGITTTTLGRHLNDHALSFYFRSPSGWHFEYGWNPRVIDPKTWRTQYFNALRPDGEWGHEGITDMI